MAVKLESRKQFYEIYGIGATKICLYVYAFQMNWWTDEKQNK